MSKKRHDRDNTPVEESDAAYREPAEESDLPAQADDRTPDGSAPAPQADPLLAAQAERDDLLQRLQRLSADYQNYQKRAQRDLARAREYANEDLLKALLSVVDDMERALQAARENNEPSDPFLEGMQLVHDNMMSVLGRFGLEVIGAEGQPFDPDQHAALMQQPSEDHPPQTVIQVLQKGYRLKDRTLRPAGVAVSTETQED